MHRHPPIRVLLAAAICAVAWTGLAIAQQPAGKPVAKTLQDKPIYDVYEPSQRLRTRRQECMRDEDAMGAYCAKKCQAGYQMEISGKNARCRAVEPLPPGAAPGPVRKEIGTQPALPKPDKPRPQQPGA